MNQYDYIQICRLLQREDVAISNQLASLQNSYQIFKEFDELDIHEILSLKVRQQCLRDFEIKLLDLCNFLMRLED